MAAHDTYNEATSRATADGAAAPPHGGRRLRLPLRNMGDLQNELARLYRSAKVGDVPVTDASRLANILQILGRLIEGTELERRIAQLEEAQKEFHR